ncbi:hypothetical protein PAMP_002096 [Pampus punctatissimus]
MSRELSDTQNNKPRRERFNKSTLSTAAQLEFYMINVVRFSEADDSVDLGRSDKQPGAKSSEKLARKATVSWWQDDEHSDKATGRATTKSRFIKAKKSQPENKEVVTAEPFYKPVPKPRRKAANKTHKHTVMEISQTMARERTPTDDFCSDSLSSPTHENIQNASGETLSNDTTEASTDSHSQGNSEDGLLASGKPFRKSVRKSQPIHEEDEDSGDTVLNKGLEAAVLSRDSTDTESLAPAVNMNSMGLDTLEEEEEKARFFAQLEAGSSSTIDYSKLNRELDSTCSTMASNLRKAEDAVEQGDDDDDDDQRKDRLTETVRDSPAYSEDFEDEENEKEKSKKSTILAKGQSYVQSGGSEMEALHDAYRQIHVVEDSDCHNLHYSSTEGRGRFNRPVSPSSPPQHAGQSLQPASTNESELPTAEELMRPIRPKTDHIGGFSFQPVSAVEFDQEKTFRSMERTFPNVASPDSHQRQPEKADSTGSKVAKGLTYHPSSSPDHSNRDLTWSIREEVERLMQDQKFSPHTSSQAGRAKKLQASRGSTTSHVSTFSLRKPSVAAVRGSRVEGRTAVTSRSTGLSRAAVTAKSQSTVSQRPREKAKTTVSQEKDDCGYTEPGLKVSSELVASVQSLVTVLQQQIDTSNHKDATDSQSVRGPQETTLTHLLKKSKEEDSSLVDELRVQLAQKEKELQIMKQGAEELNSLKQQNYLLQSKLWSAEEASQKRRLTEATDSATEEKLQQIDKEVKEQEMLIKGYQQRNEAKLSEDINRLKQEKQAVEVDMQLMKKERDLAKMQAISTSERVHILNVSGDKTFQMRVLEDKHREEVAALKKKLQWFAENQELLDRDAGRLKAATVQIHQLTEQVEKLKMEVGRRSSGHQRKAKEKSVDTKRMQDLERQVKELEQILRRRNPNSLPALIYAAATTGGQEDEDATRISPPSRISTLLERRILRLEAELESHDEEAKRSLRAMEQQFHRTMQISELEQQVEQKEQLTAATSACDTQPWESQVRGLEEELQRVKEAHQQKEKSLQDQLESLQQQLKHKAQPSPGRHHRQAEAAFGVRIDRLNQELAAKTQIIQELNRTVERLQRERRNMLSVPNTQHEARPTDKQRQPAPTKTLSLASAGEQSFPAAHCEKTYQPTVFTGSHISEVLQENEILRERLELLELHTEQEKEALKSDAVQAEEELCRYVYQCKPQQQSLSVRLIMSSVRLKQQLSEQKAEHLGVLEHLRAMHALEHSSSKVAQLTNELNTQEIRVKHLQEQLQELQGIRDALALSKTREDVLQKQLSRLLKELKQAKEAQSPEVRLVCSLERKILNMELRYQHREKELQQVTGGSWQVLDAEQQSEVDRWRHVAQDKSRELEVFRLELDSILDILRHLQRQGVVLPTADPPS